MSSWKPNKIPSAAQPAKKISGCMKKGRLGSASCLVRRFRSILNLVGHRRSMRRSIHLLDGEIPCVHFVGECKQVTIRIHLQPYRSLLVCGSSIGQTLRQALKLVMHISLCRVSALQDCYSQPTIG